MADVVAQAIETATEPLLRRIIALERAPRGVTYKGTWQRAAVYVRHEAATHAGSMWVAVADQTREVPGTGLDWQLACKAGKGCAMSDEHESDGGAWRPLGDAWTVDHAMVEAVVASAMADFKSELLADDDFPPRLLPAALAKIEVAYRAELATAMRACQTRLRQELLDQG